MIDLHLHTQASDGTWTPAEAVREAVKAGLKAIAFADHDSLAAIEAGRAAAAKHGLRFLHCVEITATDTAGDNLHILGYGVDPEAPELQRTLAKNQAVWNENERLSGESLARLGIKIDPQRYAYWQKHRQLGGWPTYNCLVEMGLVGSPGEYFAKYFGPGRPAFVHSVFIPPAEAIQAIKAAGGVPVLAHPGAYDPAGRTIMERPGFLDALVLMGLEGLETIARENGPAVGEYLLAYARRHALLATGGSDCHGDFIPERRLGDQNVPDAFLAPLLARLRPGTYV